MSLPCVSIIDGRLYFNTRDEGIRELVLRSYNDFSYFCMQFLGNVFYDGFSGQRLEIANLLSRREYPYIAVCSWRGIGKTSLMWAYAMHELLYQRRKFVLYISSTEDLSSRQTEDMKLELLLNERIREVFGSIRPEVIEERVKFGFSRRFYYLMNPVMKVPFGVVSPRGAGQAVRGSNVLLNGVKVRPDLILIDDLETDEVIRSEEQMRAIHEWFYSAVKNLTDKRKPRIDEVEGCRKWVDEGSSLFQIIVMDTKKHDLCLIGKLVEDPEWKSLVLPVASKGEDGLYYSNVPEIFSDEEIRMDIEVERSRGTFHIYSREMLCDTSGDDSNLFELSDFRYYNTNEHMSRYVTRYMVLDPARSISSRSSYTGVLFFGVNTFEGKVYIYDYSLKKLTIEELELYIINKVREHSVNCLCIEDIGLKDWIRSWVENIIQRNQLDVHILWLSSNRIKDRSFFSSTKVARVATVLPLYKSGSVYHHESLRDSVLENQLLNYPKNSIWDLLDCVGYIPYIMENEGLYFMPVGNYNLKDVQEYDIMFKEGVWRIT